MDREGARGEAPRGTGRLRMALSLWRQYGTARVAYRLYYETARRSGLLKLRFPAASWEEAEADPAIRDGSAACAEVFRVPGCAGAPRFFFAPGSPPRPEASWGDGAVAEAEAILRGKLRYFSGRPMDVGFPFAWLRNPMTGETADARRHWCDRDDFEEGQGDIRVLWEPSRFNWVYTLARAYAIRRDERFPEAFWALLESWREANPINRGPNWQCGQECALRAMALCFGLYAFAGSSSSTPERVRRLAALLAIHGRRVASNIRFARTQMGNHAVSEAAALYTLGVLFPWDAGAAQWRRRGHFVLEDEVRRHNRDDGSYAQHSMNYHRLMLHNYAWAFRLMALHGDGPSQLARSRIERGAEFLYQMQDPETGRVPNYGPNDGSLILPLNDCDSLDYRPVIAIVDEVLGGRSRYPRGPWHEDCLWILGRIPETDGDPGSRRETRGFRKGGYYVLRGRNSWGMVRCHAFTNRPNQADLLHLDLWWRGVNILRDSGSYSYNAAEPWRDYFTSTAAHNTIVVGEHSQMEKVRRFTWTHLASARLLHFIPALLPGVDCFEGEHYGYRRLPSRAVHRRAILRLGERGWLVVDDVRGLGEEQVRVFWHLADATATLEGPLIRLQTEEGVVTLWSAAIPPEGGLRLDRGVHTPVPCGWQSLRYGEKSPTPTASMILHGPLPRRIATLVLLGCEGEIALSPDGTALMASIADGAHQLRADLSPPGLSRLPIFTRLSWNGQEAAIPAAMSGGGEV